MDDSERAELLTAAADPLRLIRRLQADRPVHIPAGGRLVDVAEVESILDKSPSVAALLGPYYRTLAKEGRLQERLLPGETTEEDLQSVLDSVADLREHWHQSLGPKIEARVYTSLAEIEGYRRVLSSGFDLVTAPTPGGRRGPTPDCVASRGDDTHLFEFKSVWAYLEVRRYALRSLPNGTTAGFGATPPGRTLAEAQRRSLAVHGRELDDAEYNAWVACSTINHLLDTARRQLVSYAEAIGRTAAPKTAFLVVSQRSPIADVVHVFRDEARRWAARHADIGVEWVAGDRVEHLG
jgi:hypothetical protein